MRLDVVFTILGQQFILGSRPEEVDDVAPGTTAQVELAQPFGFCSYGEFFEDPTDPEIAA